MLPPAPSPRMNGLELALQRAWVDAAARRAKRDSLGARSPVTVDNWHADAYLTYDVQHSLGAWVVPDCNLLYLSSGSDHRVCKHCWDTTACRKKT